jgi:trehalose synthase
MLPSNKNTIWFINSTKEGGGVAEMIPHIVKEVGNHGFVITWAILATEETRFFEITKDIHNNIHDHGPVEPFSEQDRKVFQRVNGRAAEVLIT